MANAFHILGLDPGFKNLGYAVIRCSEEDVKVVLMGVFHTDKSDKLRKVLAVEDNFRRTKEIAVFLSKMVGDYSIKAICAEAISHPRNASAAAKVAMTWGVVATLSHLNRIPVVQATPQEIKVEMCGIKSASKEEVEAAVRSKTDVGNLLTGVPRGMQNHAFDAVASMLTCLKSDIILALRGRL